MATNEEYQALIDSLSGECERLHKENEELKALLKEPTGRDCLILSFVEALKRLQAENDDLKEQLKQKSCDAISREDTLKLIYDFKEKHTEDREKHPINYGTLLDLIRLIRELPSVTKKSGKWKSTIDGKPICSECGFVSESEDGYFVSHYCPNCGARMAESEEEQCGK